MRALVWFRSDLRVTDNPALYEAVRRADRGVIAVFAMCPEQWLDHDTASVRVDLLLRSLRELSDSLAGLNIALRLVSSPTFSGLPKTLVALAENAGCDEVFFNREYEWNERMRDEAVCDAVEASGRSAHSFTDQCLFEPGEIRTGEGRFYSVYSPFKRAWYRSIDEDRSVVRPLPGPTALAEMVGQPDDIPDSVSGFDASLGRPDLWTAGEAFARDRLSKFLSDGLKAYRDRRDFPGTNGTSILSPYLASGVISLRQCVAGAIDANGGRADKGSSGAVQWISELAWREFYKHILVGFPRVSRNRAFRVETEQIRWNANETHLDAWCEGRTGFPIVDAAMRQLLQTGWMHNRLRMVVAMFFSKNLFLDWRLGERFFMRHLVDGDLAANNGGWQWSASTGTDAAPYFRVFNPWSQSAKFDPEGEFILRFVPELKGLEPKRLHDPSASAVALRVDAGYPEPIVDHAQTRRTAIEAFKALKS